MADTLADHADELADRLRREEAHVARQQVAQIRSPEGPFYTVVTEPRDDPEQSDEGVSGPVASRG